jgi:hypothetical protein
MQVLEAKLQVSVGGLQALYRQIAPAYGMSKCPA